MLMIWSLLNSILFSKQHYDINTLDEFEPNPNLVNINKLKPYQHAKLNVEPIQVPKFTISMNFIQLVYPQIIFMTNRYV
jgi:hypothetical protein